MLVCKINLPVRNTLAVIKTLRQLFLQFFVFRLLSPVVFEPFFVRQRLVRVWFERIIFKSIARSICSFYFDSISSSLPNCELSVSERLSSIDDISVKMSMFAFRLCTIRQLRFLKLRHVTSHEPVSCHGQLNGCATEM